MAERDKYIYDWPRPMVTVDAIIFTFSRGKARVLLINRAHQPFRGKWALPGGFVGMDEELQTAVARELTEETGLTDIKLQQMYTFGKLARDPRGRNIAVTFMGITKRPQPKIRGSDDALKAQWFDIEKLPADLAFDHNDVIKFAVKKLKKKNIYRLRVKLKAKDK